jgi:hypothetical protein
MSNPSTLREHLKELRAGLDAHTASFTGHKDAYANLRDLLGRTKQAFQGAFPGDQSVNGHLGTIAKALSSHAVLQRAHDESDEMLDAILRSTLGALYDRAGIPLFPTPANARLAAGIGETTTSHTDPDETNTPGSFEDLPETLCTGAGTTKGLTAWQLAKVTRALTASMRQDQLTKNAPGRRLNKNAQGCHSFGEGRGAKWQPVPPLDKGRS